MVFDIYIFWNKNIFGVWIDGLGFLEAIFVWHLFFSVLGFISGTHLQQGHPNCAHEGSTAKSDDQGWDHNWCGRRLRLTVGQNFGSVHHGNIANISIGYGKENDQDDESNIWSEENLKSIIKVIWHPYVCLHFKLHNSYRRIDTIGWTGITEEEQWDKDHSGQRHGHHNPTTRFGGLGPLDNPGHNSTKIIANIEKHKACDWNKVFRTPTVTLNWIQNILKRD